MRLIRLALFALALASLIVIPSTSLAISTNKCVQKDIFPYAPIVPNSNYATYDYWGLKGTACQTSIRNGVYLNSGFDACVSYYSSIYEAQIGYIYSCQHGPELCYLTHYYGNSSCRWSCEPVVLNVDCAKCDIVETVYPETHNKTCDKPQPTPIYEVELARLRSEELPKCGVVSISSTSYDPTISRINRNSLPFFGSLNTGNVQAQWTLSVLGWSYEGTGSSVGVRWDTTYGPDNPRIVEPGGYSATLSLHNGCGGSETLPFHVEELTPKQCRLKVNFGSSAHLSSGNLYHSQSLFSTQDGSTDLALHYNSLDAYNGPLGLSWTHSYNIRLKDAGRGTYLLMEADGERTLLYPRDGGAYYTPSSASYPVMRMSAQGLPYVYHKRGEFYYFDAQGRIASIEDVSRQSVTTLAYDASTGWLATVTDARGRTSRFGYTPDGRISSVADPAGNAYAFNYNAQSLAAVTYPDGSAWSYEYDAKGFMVRKVDPAGAGTAYGYDANYMVSQSTGPTGLVRTLAYDLDNATSYLTEPGGGVWTYSYDAEQGLLLGKTDPLGGVTSYAYDSSRNMTAKTEPDGSVTTYAYDAYGNMLTMTDTSGTTSYTYNSQSQITSVTDPQGQVTSYAYDQSGNLLALTSPDGLVTSYTYNDKGLVASISNPAIGTTSYVYDLGGNMVSTTSPTGAMTSYTYDAMGRVLSTADSNGAVTSYQYDLRGNLIKTTDPLGNSITYTYDSMGHKLSQKDANGNVTTYAYDASGNLIRVTDSLGNSTVYSYGGAGCSSCGGGESDKLTSITDAAGNVTRYEYDILGRLTKETDPLGAVTSYTYDAAGRMSSKTDALGNTVSFAYDAQGRMLKKTYADGTFLEYRYDSTGRVTYTANSAMSYSMTYDPAGRLLTSTDTSGMLLKYTYDNIGRKVKAETPAGAMSYSYNTTGQLASIDSPSGKFMFTYDAQGRRTSLKYPNGVSGAYNYDTTGRLTSIAYKASAGAVIESIGYTHDRTGNRVARVDVSKTMSYSYDPLSQLVEAISNAPGRSTRKAENIPASPNPTVNQRERYTYDSVGNRLIGPDAHDAYVYSVGNRLVSDSHTIYQYDALGNLITKTTSEGVTSYSYDFENRLSKVTLPDGKVVSFAYDPMGRRIEKNAAGVLTRYFYDGEDIAFEYSSTGIGNVYSHGPGIDEPLGLTQATKSYYYHADGLSSIIKLTDDKQKVAQEYEYDSFGNLHDQSNRIKQPFTYTGREWDREVGLFFYRARHYDSEAGRFTQEDPRNDFYPKLSKYVYVKNNPSLFADPSGRTEQGNYNFDDDYYKFLRCVSACIECKDMLNDLGKVTLSFLGMPIPKQLFGYSSKALGGSTRVTTIPSVIQLNSGIPLRIAGRACSVVWTAYGIYMAGVEVHCTAKCLADRDAF